MTDSGRLEATITPSALSLPDGVTFAPTGLVIHQALTREDYDLTGRHLRLIDEALQWWWGDWLAYGERVYGETYAQYAEVAGKHPDTLKNWVYVANAVALSRRRDDLTPSHHAAVASLEPDQQTDLLAQAADQGWTVKTLRHEKAQRFGNGPEPTIYDTCPTCGGSGRLPTDASD